MPKFLNILLKLYLFEVGREMKGGRKNEVKNWLSCNTDKIMIEKLILQRFFCSFPYIAWLTLNPLPQIPFFMKIENKEECFSIVFLLIQG